MAIPKMFQSSKEPNILFILYNRTLFCPSKYYTFLYFYKCRNQLFLFLTIPSEALIAIRNACGVIRLNAPKIGLPIWRCLSQLTPTQQANAYIWITFDACVWVRVKTTRFGPRRLAAFSSLLATATKHNALRAIYRII